ncbi:MAG: LPP20 family lipoprotein [Campylobacterota bacterium]
MKKILASSAVAATLLFTGCIGGGEPETTEDAYVNPELKGAPQWVMMPQVEGSISEVGSAKPNAANDIGFQRNMAMADARDNLARQIETNVGNMIKTYTATTGGGESGTYDSANEAVSKQVASQTLSGTVVKDTWMSRSGTLYVLMAVDTEAVIDAMDKPLAASTSFGNDEALYQQFKASKAQGDLSEELEKLNR